jgi:type II secretory ATPase GspE/PulE/Tfp pilus assembly ATPase PilB-like protein
VSRHFPRFRISSRSPNLHSECSRRRLKVSKLQLIREDESGDETITIEKITQEESSPIIRLVDTVIFTALERRASDIHIETRDTEVV